MKNNLFSFLFIFAIVFVSGNFLIDVNEAEARGGARPKSAEQLLAEKEAAEKAQREFCQNAFETYGIGDRTGTKINIQLDSGEYVVGCISDNVTNTIRSSDRFRTSVQSPLPPSVKKYKPGEAFDLRIDYFMAGCYNHANYMYFTPANRIVKVGEVKTYGEQKLLKRGGDTTYLIGRKGFFSEVPKYKYGPLYAPNEPGIYRVYYKLGYNYWDNRRYNWIEGEYYAEFEVSGEPQPLSLSCRPLQTEVLPGSTVTFEANITTQNPNDIATLVFRDGPNATSPILRTLQNVRGTQTITKVYPNTGYYQVFITATDTAGNVASCLAGVTISGSPEEDDDNTQQNNTGDGTLIDADGDGIPDTADNGIGRNLPDPSIEFSLDREITNTTCKADWKAGYARSCQLVNLNSGTATVIDLIGTQEVSPGTYRIDCVGANGRTKSSPVLICLRNVDVREI